MRVKQLLITSVLFLIVSIVNGQTKNNYTAQWKKVDSLISQRGLTRSALTEVEKIYASAKKEKNDAQIIKALVYNLQLQEQFQENATQQAINTLQKEIAAAAEPAKSLLKSILAEKIWFFYQRNRYELYDRTTVKNFRQADIETWDAEALVSYASKLYLESIANETLLQQTKLEPFDAIIIKGNVRYLRPTLYDLLAHRALSYFRYDDSRLPKPADAFDLSQAVAFAEPERFSSFKFETKDTLSLKFKAIQVYQRLIKFHLKDARPDALIDADISRLQFAYASSVMEEADKTFLYRNGLNRILKKYPEEAAATQAGYLLATSYFDQGLAYNPPNDTSGHYDLLKAKEIAEKIAARKDSAEGVVNSRLLMQRILQKELSFEAEKVDVPDKPFRVLVTYRNVSQMHIRVIKLDDATREKLGTEDWQKTFWQSAAKLPALKTFAQDLPATNDHQKHKVEIKIDALPAGQYALLVATDKNFTVADDPLAMQYFYVSNIAYVNNVRDYFVLNRETGQPIRDAKVQAWYTSYDYNINRWKKTKGALFTTDNNGYFLLTDQALPAGVVGRDIIKLEITTANDRLYTDDHIYSGEYNGTDKNEKPDAKKFEKENRRTFLFTDRSIYRPGQTVYFKGIVLTRDFQTRNSKILAATASTVYLRDANGETVDSLKVTTNEFGSYSGKFTLPASTLTGNFSIEDANAGQMDFSVEEYKRPKFFVEYKLPEGVYRVNDTITVHGFAKAYAGNNIDGANVKYKVTRQPRFIYPWAMWKIRFPRMEQQEIAHGEVKTNADGTFTIRFVALPDKSISPETQPVFDYSISTDVTDAAGETRSANTVVSVSYEALQVKVYIPASRTAMDDMLPADSLTKLTVRTTNLAGQFQPSAVTVAIYKLNAPQRLIRERVWEQPDQFVMTKEEYLRNFPNDEYSNEQSMPTWERLQKVYERKDSSKADGSFNLSGGTSQRQTVFEPGWYAIEAITVDKYGQQVKDIVYTQLVDTKTGRPSTPSYIWSYPASQTSEPGQAAIINIGSSAENLFLVQELNRYIPEGSEYGAPGWQTKAEQTITYNYSPLSNENKIINIPVSETDRGGFRVAYMFVKHNRFYTADSRVLVPRTNKELDITYATYRDKTLPGSQEKWKVKVAGKQNEKVAAEVLTAMYDASLDQFKPHSWNTLAVWPEYYTITNFESNNFQALSALVKTDNIDYSQIFRKQYDYLVTTISSGVRDGMANAKMARQTAPMAEVTVAASGRASTEERFDMVKEMAGNIEGDGSKPLLSDTPQAANPNNDIQIRKNFNETAFFFPDLKTDSSGNVEFSFTMPEALTEWKWMMLAHTKDLATAYSTKSIVTQKELMVQPNVPRFVREGDRMDLSAKLVNMSDKELSGQIELQLRDATTNQPVDGWFQNMFPNQYFTAAAGQSTVINFTIQAPYQFNKPLIVRFIARAGNVSDGEENAIPVLSNRLLVTETLPLNVRGGGSKNFSFEKLVNSANSETLSHHALTVEFTSNPAWYAVQALPYLMEYPYECAEQVWNRVYANALASKIVNASPRIKQIFEKWRTSDTAALISNLQKNEELKNILLEETPWVLEAKNETEQKRRIAMLFDMVKLSAEFNANVEKLAAMQTVEGAFPWFRGGQNDRYITQYIVAGIGHLKKLNALTPAQQEKLQEIVDRALGYMDKAIKTDYDRLVKQKADMSKQHIDYMQIHYLYARSFFKDVDAAGYSAQPFNYYRKQSQQFWLQQGRYAQGMIALSLFRTGDGKTSVDILRSLKQNAIVNAELGMYWKDMPRGYYWHQAPIETQALMIEAFTEITKDLTTADALKTWLLKNKQTNNWNTTKATADACYALLLQGTDWLSSEPVVQVKLGDKNVSSLDQKSEAGSGYFKKVFDAPFVNSTMGNITVNVTQPNAAAGKPSTSTSWGAVYWQYFENLENITPAATPLKLVKKLFVERNTNRGPVLEPIGDNGIVKVGDKVKVRIELRVDRDMEYVHMKDMRASALEPVNVLSSWKWQGGLGYYESTRDASTNFFFSYLPKGTYVFEYPLFVTHTGSFSNGITTIQCMYAPEFSSHSEGVKINVE